VIENVYDTRVSYMVYSGTVVTLKRVNINRKTNSNPTVVKKAEDRLDYGRAAKTEVIQNTDLGERSIF
jgi:hypothetical protein